MNKEDNDKVINNEILENQNDVPHKTGALDGILEKEKQSRANQSQFFKILTVMTIIFLGVILAIFLFADNETFLEEKFGPDSFITTLFNNLSKSNSNKEKATFGLPFGAKKQNILLLGVDSNGKGSDLWKGTRTDTIVLINIDPRTKSLNAISIPRDSKVYLPHNKGVQKINAAHAIGGVDMTVATIENTLGVKINRYVVVHNEAVKNIVDAIGGIDIYVEKNMHYNDYAGNLHVNLTKGEHHLNGKEAVGYLRFRHDALGDIGRTKRQQWFLKGFLEALQKPQTIAKIPQLLSITNQYVKTNMSVYEMSQYAAVAKHFDMDNIEIATLPGGPNAHGYTSYWILDPEQTQEIVNRLIYRREPITDKTDFTASVLYSRNQVTNAEKLIQELKTQNIDVKCTGTSSSTHSQFIAHDREVTPAYYKSLKKSLSDLKTGQFVYDPANYYCGSTDFTIILAGE